MEIFYLESVDSTQNEVKRRLKLKSNDLDTFCVVSEVQTAGMGSRENRWTSERGNLFFSFTLPIVNLPTDLPIQSASLYFGYLFKALLVKLGSKAWLKWPNDIYIKNNKIGGVLTHLVGKNLICGIGINLVPTKDWENLEISVDKKEILDEYFSLLKFTPSWDEIFIQYSVEFNKSRRFTTHVKQETIELDAAELCSDGSLLINGQKVYSIR